MANIICRHISFTAINNMQDSLPILKNVNLTINSGDFAIILGKSGSGKTTLLNILVGLLSPTVGEVIIDGQDITKMSEVAKTYWRRYDIGYIFQNYGLINVINVYDNIRLTLDLDNLFSIGAKKHVANYQRHTNNDKNFIETVMQRLNISHLKDKFPHELSGGQQQRVAIARTIVKKPKFIFCDEPTGALDHITSIEVMEMLKFLNDNGSTIVMITHNTNLIHYANRVIKISDGELIDQTDLNRLSRIHLVLNNNNNSLKWNITQYQAEFYKYLHIFYRITDSINNGARF